MKWRRCKDVSSIELMIVYGRSKVWCESVIFSFVCEGVWNECLVSHSHYFLLHWRPVDLEVDLCQTLKRKSELRAAISSKGRERSWKRSFCTTEKYVWNCPKNDMRTNRRRKEREMREMIRKSFQSYNKWHIFSSHPLFCREQKYYRW